MTVPVGQVPIINYEYAGPGEYDFSFRVFTRADLALSMINSEGLRRPLDEFTDYTVTVTGDGSLGGTCDLLVPEEVATLEVRRSVVQEQPTEWENNNPLNAALLEVDLDRAIMIIQDMQVYLDSEYLISQWRGDWLEVTEYQVGDIVKAPNTNWYMCRVAHESGTEFDPGLESGYWVLILDMILITESSATAVLAAAEALESAYDSSVSATESASSASQSAVSSANAAISETNAVNCSNEAHESAVEAEAAKDEAEDIALRLRTDRMHTDYYTATSGQTVFEVTHPAPEVSVQVFKNSLKLRRNEDFTTDDPASTTEITLLVGATEGDEIDVVSFNFYDSGHQPVAPNMVFMNDIVATEDFAVYSGTNGVSVGPVTLNPGVEVTVAEGSTYVIL